MIAVWAPGRPPGLSMAAPPGLRTRVQMPIHMGMNAIAHASALPTSGPKLDNRRVLAALIDLGVLALGAGLIGFVAGALNGGEVEFTPALDVILLGWALYYYFACESGGGQTIGKRLMRLRVVRADGGHAGMGEILVRTILRVIDGIALYLVGLVVMLVTGERRQRLGDLAAGTIVVDANEAQSGAAGPVKPVYVDAVPPQAITLPDYRQDWIPEDAAAPEAPQARVMPEAPAVSDLRPFEPPHEVEPPPSKPLAEVERQVEVEPLEPVVEVEPIVEVEPCRSSRWSPCRSSRWSPCRSSRWSPSRSSRWSRPLRRRTQSSSGRSRRSPRLTSSWAATSRIRTRPSRTGSSRTPIARVAKLAGLACAGGPRQQLYGNDRHP